jgi:DNA polymerase
MFISAPGYDLLCSDYSAIEAVVLAAIAGEEWRLEVFRTHGKIYEMSGAKISRIPFDDVLSYKEETGKHHPCRKLGKVAELASGYGGWINGWKAFGADSFLTEKEIKEAVLAWRDQSPAIVRLWEGLEKAAKDAVQMPGVEFSYRGIKYLCKQNILYCILLSGRLITYHKPLLSIGDRGLSLSYEGWNTNPKNGRIGWTRMNTYGGKLTENVIQATARDILTHAIVKLEYLGYPVVLHVHDEIVCEVPEWCGDIKIMEEAMSRMPKWAEGWPVVAKGGWRAKRYAK